MQSKAYRRLATFILLIGTAIVPADAQRTTPAEPRLSREFAASALRALSAVREWRAHIALTLDNGYPLSESWMAGDSTKVRDAMAEAAIDASTSEDRTALQEIANYSLEVRTWSDSLLAANRELRLAQLYMSPNALRNDSIYTAMVDCGELLTIFVGKRQAPETHACHSSSARAWVGYGTSTNHQQGTN